MKPQDVAVTLAVSLGSIHKWHARWRQEGLDGLANHPKSGAPPKADEAYWQRVEAVVAQAPHVFGYPFNVWTSERLLAHMAAETGVELSASRFQTVMRQRGYVYRRPKHDLGNLQDPAARTAAEAWLDELKKGRLPASSTSSLWTKQR
jgi:transposase